LGLTLDIANYGARSGQEKLLVNSRTTDLTCRLLSDLAVDPKDTYWQDTGDGVLLFLLKELDVQSTLPVLLQSAATYLASDNKVYKDQLQLRMAVDVGPIAVADRRIEGDTATILSRLVDGEPLRERLKDPTVGQNLAVVISQRLHSFVVAEGTPRLPPSEFRNVPISVKEFTDTAWLWTGDDQQ
jgi:hypothetical protein